MQTPLTELKWACHTLEGIRVYTCGAMPGGAGTTFSDISLEDGGSPVTAPAWTPTVAHDNCGEAVDIDAGSGDISLHYNANTSSVQATTH